MLGYKSVWVFYANFTITVMLRKTKIMLRILEGIINTILHIITYMLCHSHPNLLLKNSTSSKRIVIVIECPFCFHFIATALKEFDSLKILLLKRMSYLIDIDACEERWETDEHGWKEESEKQDPQNICVTSLVRMPIWGTSRIVRVRLKYK